MRKKSAVVYTILLAASVVSASVSAPARAQGYFGVSAGLYQPEDAAQDTTENFDIRCGYRIRPPLGFEWSLNRVSLANTVPFQADPTVPGIDFDKVNLDVDLYNLDLSVQWFPRQGNFVVFGGPGLSLVDAKLNVTFLGGSGTDPDNTTVFTAHAGLAYVWRINDRFFLRPEARVRHYFGQEVNEPNRIEAFYYSYKATDYVAGLTFGWRFGT
jgi:hypothetical protein